MVVCPWEGPTVNVREKLHLRLSKWCNDVLTIAHYFPEIKAVVTKQATKGVSIEENKKVPGTT